jgi:pimeloyl-ACP methyl ester carboxylesterase
MDLKVRNSRDGISSPLRHSVITSDGVKIGIMEWRPDVKSFRYLLVLIHGYAQNNLSWHGRSGGLAPELQKMGFHVFSVDLRGSGLSRLKKIRYDFTFDDFVFKDVKEVVDFIRAKEKVDKVVLAGHSLGGIVSYSFSAFFPE